MGAKPNDTSSRGADPGDRRSVLSQSTTLKSGSAMALGALMSKSSGSRPSKRVEGSSDLQSIAPGTSATNDSATLVSTFDRKFSVRKSYSDREPLPSPADTDQAMAALSIKEYLGHQDYLSQSLEQLTAVSRIEERQESRGERAVYKVLPAERPADKSDGDACQDDIPDDAQSWLSSEEPSSAARTLHALHTNMVDMVYSMADASDERKLHYYYTPAGSQFAVEKSRLSSVACCSQQCSEQSLEVSIRPRNVEFAPKLQPQAL